MVVQEEILLQLTKTEEEGRFLKCFQKIVRTVDDDAVLDGWGRGKDVTARDTVASSCRRSMFRGAKYYKIIIRFQSQYPRYSLS